MRPDPISPAALVELLHRFGYLDTPEPEQRELSKASILYRKFHELVGMSVPEHLSLPRCGVPDVQPQGLLRQVCRWTHSPVRCDFRFAVGGLSESQVSAAFRWALDRWAAVCGFRWEPAGLRPANVVSRPGSIDGPGNILAISYLPCGASPGMRITQTYDNRERYKGDATLFPAVVLHELGHAIGLDHSPDRRAIMYPIIQPNVRDLGGDDIKRAKALYPR